MADLHPDNPYAEERHPDAEKSYEFSSEQMEEFNRILERYPNKQAALLPVLHLAQRTWDWLPPGVIVYVSELLGLTPSYVFGVVTFYNMYNQKPRGKYFMQICTNLPCMLRGAYDIYEDLCENLSVHPGENTEDGKFTVLEVECLGSCGTAPVVQVNNDYHEEMTVEKTRQLMKTLD
ncbi:MAG: NAD(P)H-dependent oxidoreductase subunit E [Thermoanaerobaculia bacterium]|nr:NAD(P)H-dependent oxidoreductase subunit E [Thermoanaerobaculia bacterium]